MKKILFARLPANKRLEDNLPEQLVDQLTNRGYFVNYCEDSNDFSMNLSFGFSEYSGIIYDTGIITCAKNKSEVLEEILRALTRTKKSSKMIVLLDPETKGISLPSLLREGCRGFTKPYDVDIVARMAMKVFG